MIITFVKGNVTVIDFCNSKICKEKYLFIRNGNSFACSDVDLYLITISITIYHLITIAKRLIASDTTYKA